MDSLRVAHISDLHFGADGQDETWLALTKHLREEIRPDLILVTGDIVDTPKNHLYAEAKKSLDQLCQSIQGKSQPVKYYVCPGNHDRFPKGTRWSFLPTNRFKKAAFDFDFIFQGRIPSLTEPANIALGPANNRWTIRVLGLDSSRSADFAARGYISLEEMSKLDQAMADSDDTS